MSLFGRPVEETIMRAGFDAEQIIVVGGSALAIFGVREAQDVDLLLAPELFSRIGRYLQTPGGIRLNPAQVFSAEKRYLSVGTEPGCLPLDLLTVEGNDPDLKFNLLATMMDVIPCDGGILRAPSLKTISKIKEIKKRTKDLEDVQLIKQHLAALNETAA